MARQHALKVLNALANGVNPVTGEVFAADSLYQHPDTVRALFEAVRALGSDSTKSRDETPVGTFVRWTPEEEERLTAEFDAGKNTAELAKLHDRSRAARSATAQARQDRRLCANGATAISRRNRAKLKALS
jgi:ABC-type nitrate/sulfonate/bicarbonate transport system substrate-binding protein